MSDVDVRIHAMCVDHAGAWIISGRREAARASGERERVGARDRRGGACFVCLRLVCWYLKCSCCVLLLVLLKCVSVCVKMIFRNSLSRATQLRDTSHTHIFRAGPPSEAAGRPHHSTS